MSSVGSNAPQGASSSILHPLLHPVSPHPWPLTSGLLSPSPPLTTPFCVSEDQILVELGRSDDFTGEQKNRFIQGLREVLQGFRANKVKDFDAIARGIIEYRSRFLADKSRVLHLEGVSI
jgi:hypothetical protein